MRQIGYIYTPRSGSRWLSGPGTHAEGPNLEVEVLDNASLVVRGEEGHDWREVAIPTALMGSWWRDVARAVARELPSLFPCVTWDECGDIHIIYPGQEHDRLRLIMREALRLANLGVRADLQAYTALQRAFAETEARAAARHADRTDRIGTPEERTSVRDWLYEADHTAREILIRQEAYARSVGAGDPIPAQEPEGTW